MALTTTAAALVAKARARIKEVETADALAMVNNPNVVIVDIRGHKRAPAIRLYSRISPCATWHDRILGRPGQPLFQGCVWTAEQDLSVSLCIWLAVCAHSRSTKGYGI